MIAGVGAVAVMAVLGACSTVTGGHARVNQADAPAYRTSMSASVAESSASSAARESDRQESMTVEAIHTACETLSTSSADAIDTVNEYVAAANGDGDTDATEGPAADALNHSADLVEADLNDALPEEIWDALTDWSDAARATAMAVVDRVSPDEFNSSVDRLNDSRSHALDLCDASY